MLYRIQSRILSNRLISSRTCRNLSRATAFLAVLLVSHGIAVSQDRFLQWSDNTGRFKVDAEFIRIEGEQVVLRKLDGKDVKIPFDRLSPESLELAKRKGGLSSPKTNPTNPSAPTKPSNPTVNPTPNPDKTAKPSSTPSPTPPSNTSPATNAANVPVVRFQDNMDAKEFVDQVFSELSKENTIVLWDALPPSKQKQIENVVVTFASKVDPKSFDAVRKIRNSVVEILRKQQKFILQSNVLQIPSNMVPELEKSYPAGVDFIDSLISKDLLDGKRLQKGDTRGLLAAYVQKINETGEKLVMTLPPDNPGRQQLEQARKMGFSPGAGYQVEKTSSTTATLTMDAPATAGAPTPPPMKLVLSEGRWLPEEMVSNWDQMMNQAQSAISTMKPEEIQQALSFGALFITAPLNNLKNAKSQEEFDKALTDIIGPIMANMGGLGGPGAGGPQIGRAHV